MRLDMGPMLRKNNSIGLFLMEMGQTEALHQFLSYLIQSGSYFISKQGRVCVHQNHQAGTSQQKRLLPATASVPSNVHSKCN